ncbi:MAG TPA: metalloprotease [Planctomycetaceae bacterium]|nr:metalloprotease [Planctomycetaceae bacterium]
MRWKGREQSKNVIDNRGKRGAVAAGGGLGLIGIIIAVVFTLMRGGDAGDALKTAVTQAAKQAAQSQAVSGARDATTSEADQEMREFVAVVLKDTEDVWSRLLPEMGIRYRAPKLVMFSDRTPSACGSATSAVGPFYCPGDNQVYLDTVFFNELQTRFNAPGDFACAYVIAHEVGHHIQNLMGKSMEVQSQQARLSKKEGNRLSVRLELQADFLAGVWAHHAQKMKQILDPGDIEEALVAAQAIGDDTLMRNAGAAVRPDSFTHGTSEQRIYWFKRGLSRGDLREINLPFEIAYDQL